MAVLSRRVTGIKPPMTREMTRLGNELARAGRSIMSLAQGEPDFDTPVHVREAGKRAIDTGQTRYTDIPGSRELTEAIIRKFQRDNGLTFKPTEITIGVGSKQVLYNALQATVQAGDEVIVALLYEEREHRAPKALGEQCFGHRRTRGEGAIGAEHPVGGEHVPQPSGYAQLPCMPSRALPQRACSRVAWPIEAAGCRRNAGADIRPLSAVRAMPLHPGGNAPAAGGSTSREAPIE